MPIRKLKPRSPGVRFQTISGFDEITKTDPEKSNYFLNNFVQTVSYDNEQNNDGLNKAVTNTFARLTDNQKIKVQNGFNLNSKLYIVYNFICYSLRSKEIFNEKTFYFFFVCNFNLRLQNSHK